MPKDHKTSPSPYGVTVKTWGTEPGRPTGILKHFDGKLYGGNVGHSAVEICFPANEHTEELIEKYVPDRDDSSAYTVTKKEITLENGKKEEVYYVYFSWYGQGTTRSALDDQIYQRLGTEYKSQPGEVPGEYRVFPGAIGKRKIKIKPVIGSEIQQKNLSDEDYNKLCKQVENIELHETLKSLGKIVAGYESKLSKLYDSNYIKLSKKTIDNINNLLFDDKEDKASDNLSIDSVIDLIRKLKFEKSKLETSDSSSDDGWFCMDSEDGDVSASDDDKSKKTDTEALDLKKEKIEQCNTLIEELSDLVKSAEEKSSLPLNSSDIFKIKNALGIDFDSSTDKITGIELKSLIANFYKKINEVSDQVRANKQFLDGWEMDDYTLRDHHVDQIGLKPYEATLPIKQDGKDGKDGLDVEFMLKKINKLVYGPKQDETDEETHDDKESFDLYGKNCSITVAKIISAGLGKEQFYLRKMIKSQEFGFFTTPQILLNSATDLSEHFSNGKSVQWYHNLQYRVNFIEKFIANLLSAFKVTNDEGTNKTTIKVDKGKAAAYISAAVLLLPFVGTAKALEKMLNPLDFFKAVLNNLSYILKRDNVNASMIAFKVLAIMTLTPVLTLYAAPAAMQGVIKSIIDLAESAITKIKSKVQKKSDTDETLQELLEPLLPKQDDTDDLSTSVDSTEQELAEINTWFLDSEDITLEPLTIDTTIKTTAEHQLEVKQHKEKIDLMANHIKYDDILFVLQKRLSTPSNNDNLFACYLKMNYGKLVSDIKRMKSSIAENTPEESEQELRRIITHIDKIKNYLQNNAANERMYFMLHSTTDGKNGDFGNKARGGALISEIDNKFELSNNLDTLKKQLCDLLAHVIIQPTPPVESPAQTIAASTDSDKNQVTEQEQDDTVQPAETTSTTVKRVERVTTTAGAQPISRQTDELTNPVASVNSDEQDRFERLSMS